MMFEQVSKIEEFVTAPSSPVSEYYDGERVLPCSTAPSSPISEICDLEPDLPQDFECTPALPFAQDTSHSLNILPAAKAPKIEKFVIVVSPASTAPSSPSSDHSDASSYFNHTQPSPPTTEGSQALSFMQYAVTSFLTLYASGVPQVYIEPCEDALVAYLHRNAARPSDIQVLIPSLAWNARVMGKLTTNIALFRSKKWITDAELEDMLVHIFVNNDAGYSLFTRTKGKIEKVRREHEEWVKRKWAAKQRRESVSDECRK